MLLHSIVYACRCARVQAKFEAVEAEEATEPAPNSGDFG